jgi:hypothetical protein
MRVSETGPSQTEKPRITRREKRIALVQREDQFENEALVRSLTHERRSSHLCRSLAVARALLSSLRVSESDRIVTCGWLTKELHQALRHRGSRPTPSECAGSNQSVPKVVFESVEPRLMFCRGSSTESEGRQTHRCQARAQSFQPD